MVSDDDNRSPPQAPALTTPKPLDATPHSARSGTIVNNLTRSAQQAPLPAHDARQSYQHRVEQASPCRPRVVGSSTAGAAAAAAGGPLSLGGVQSNRSYMQPPPKTLPSGPQYGTWSHTTGELGQRPVVASPLKQALVGIATTPLRPQR